MPTKLEYLNEALRTEICEKTLWHELVFTEKVNAPKEKIEKLPYMLFTENSFLYYYDSDLNIQKIEDATTPLFSYLDEIEVSPYHSPYITKPIKTNIGAFIINKVANYPSFKGKIPYIEAPINTKKIQDILAKHVVSDQEAKETDATVTEMVEFIDRLYFFTNLAHIVNRAASQKTIVEPPGIKEYREKLLKEYKDKLNDPIAALEFEKKLKDYDAKHLQGDSVAKMLGSSKKGQTARQKLYLMFGSNIDFKDENLPPVTTPLKEGLDPSSQTFYRYNNDLRFGSYSRGAATAKSGYIGKILQRALAYITIDSTECNTTKGIKRLATQSNYKRLYSRYIKHNNSWILVSTEEQAKEYIGKVVEIRSSMYCTAPGRKICYKCISDNYKNTPAATTLITSELSRVLNSLNMKLMHGITTESTVVKLDDLIT